MGTRTPWIYNIHVIVNPGYNIGIHDKVILGTGTILKIKMKILSWNALLPDQ